jgi:D-alanyl-D-alanine carboxypeptidase
VLGDREEAINRLLLAEVSERGGGAAVAISKDGEPVFAKGYGQASVEWNASVTPDTIFPIASISKPLTALAIMTLVEEHKLALEDRVDAYLSPLPRALAPITIEHLLTHTSGIRNFNEKFNPTERQRSISVQELLPEIVQLPCDFPPSTRWSYSNSGYILLSYIAERVSGLSFGQFMQRRLFEPLGMTRSSLLHDRAILPGRASGYQTGRHGLERADYMSFSWYRGAGALTSTASDLARLEAGIAQNKIVSSGLFDRMLKPARLTDGSTYPYGLGWGVSEYLGRPVHHHTGGIQGFRGEYLRLPRDGLAVTVLANHSDFPFHRITCTLARLLLRVSDPGREEIIMNADDRKSMIGDFVSPAGGAELRIRDEQGRLRCSGASTAALALDRYGNLYDAQDPEVILDLERDGAGRVSAVTLGVPMFADQRFVRRV